MVTVVIQWMGQTSEGRNINHTIDILTMPTKGIMCTLYSYHSYNIILYYAVLLYNCLEVATGCSSCIGTSIASGFECGWCDRPSGMTDTCSFTGDCPSKILTATGSQCPMPTIIDFTPKFGPPQGGTTITITGTDLGVSFSDFIDNSIRVGGVNCMPTNPDGYLPGRRINCTTTSSGVSASVMIMLSNGNVTSGETLFTRVSPEITRIFPSRGPQAGGTNLTVYGTNLDIGNTEDTRITLVGGTQCTIK
jgi:plexin A